MAKKEKSGIEIIEDSDALKKKVFKVEGFFEKNQKAVLGAGIVLVALVAGFFGYNYWNKSQEKEAQSALFDAVYSFEADSTAQALKGQGGERRPDLRGR